MLRLSHQAVSTFMHAAQLNFARELCHWWSRRLPWFVELPPENQEATGLHVIDEASSYGYVAEADIMRYSIGYIYFGSCFPESPLYENLLERCHWKDKVAPILKLVRVLDHVDMLLWDGTFSLKRGCLENLPPVTDWPLIPLELHQLEVVLQSVQPRRLVHLNRERLPDYVRLLNSRRDGAGIPPAWQLRAAMLGVFLGWNWTQSPAWAWIVAAMQRGDTDTIMRRLCGAASCDVAFGESLYGIARKYGTDIRDLQVQRGDKVIDLGDENVRFDPKSLGPDDKVLIADGSHDSIDGDGLETA